MPDDCKTCHEHGAFVVELEHLAESVKEQKEYMAKLTSQVSELKTEILKLESREKIMLGVFALAGTVLSSLGSIIGCAITAYLK